MTRHHHHYSDYNPPPNNHKRLLIGIIIFLVITFLMAGFALMKKFKPGPPGLTGTVGAPRRVTIQQSTTAHCLELNTPDSTYPANGINVAQDKGKCHDDSKLTKNHNAWQYIYNGPIKSTVDDVCIDTTTDIDGGIGASPDACTNNKNNFTWDPITRQLILNYNKGSLTDMSCLASVKNKLKLKQCKPQYGEDKDDDANISQSWRLTNY